MDYYNLKVIEYQEAWANTRHYDVIYRSTLFVILSYSLAAMVLYGDGKPYGVFACFLGLIISVFSFFALEKITWHYDRAFEIIKNIENELNNHIQRTNENFSKIRLGVVDKLQEKPRYSGTFKNKTMGTSILALNAFAQFIVLVDYLMPIKNMVHNICIT